MLKIPDGDTKKAALPVAPETSERTKNVQKENKALDTPPLVQQLFDVSIVFKDSSISIIDLSFF